MSAGVNEFPGENGAGTRTQYILKMLLGVAVWGVAVTFNVSGYFYN
jgi:hypothetical protein